MTISITGSRASATDWDAVRNIPPDQLPALTPEQLEVARDLHIPEVDYARSALVGRKGAEKLLAKTERFARLLRQKVQAREPSAEVEKVTLNVWEERFEADLRVSGASCPIRVAEDLVDEWFERGSSEAEQRLERVVGLAFAARTTA